MPFTNSEKQQAAEREVSQRRHVYPRLIEKGRMTKQLAERQIALMQEIAEDYGKLAEGERLL